jgi:hypothetical protein
MNIPGSRWSGRRYEYEDLVFWAQDGAVQVFDRRDGTFSAVTLARWGDRIDAMARERCRIGFPGERLDRDVVLEQMGRVFREAQMQGDPTNREVMLYKSRHKARSLVLAGGDWRPERNLVSA